MPWCGSTCEWIHGLVWYAVCSVLHCRWMSFSSTTVCWRSPTSRMTRSRCTRSTLRQAKGQKGRQRPGGGGRGQKGGEQRPGCGGQGVEARLRWPGGGGQGAEASGRRPAGGGQRAEARGWRPGARRQRPGGGGEEVLGQGGDFFLGVLICRCARGVGREAAIGDGGQPKVRGPMLGFRHLSVDTPAPRVLAACACYSQVSSYCEQGDQRS